jgi:23S rRNA pseudouridine1911/1915/1917 synthase
MRLDLKLIALHPELSRRRARDAIEKGQVTVDGHTVREPGYAVGGSARVSWDPNRKALPRARLSLPLLHADEALLIVDKPPGLLSVPSGPGAQGEDTALARVQEYVRHLTPRHPYVGVVHRIDRDTSGALAFALSEAARRALRRLFREHRIERRYAALVAGSPRGERGAVDLPIHDAYEGGRRRVARPGEPSRPALTRWSVVERFADAALLAVELETGRQHQIRVHLAHVGLPILGDPVYGRRASPASAPAAARQMLHAERLAFTHPLSGSRVHAEAALPADFVRVLEALRRARPALRTRGR